MVRKTSKEAYKKVLDKLSKRRAEVYKILYKHGPLTSNEIFQYARLHGNLNYRHNTNARMTELRALGVVAELGTKACSVTGLSLIHI